MTFPTTSVLDNFNRSAGTNPNYLGGNWSSNGGLSITGNQVYSLNGASPQTEIYTVSKYGADTEVYGDIVTLPALGNGIILEARDADSGANNLYFCEYVHGSPGYVFFGKFVVGNLSNIGSNTNVTFSAGDSFGFSVVGTTLTSYRKTSGTWSSIANVTDVSLSTLNYIGFGIDSDTTARLDNFGGGTVVTSSANWLKQGFWADNPYFGRNV